MRSVLGGPSIQARCLECPAGAPAKLDRRDLGLIGLVEEWLR
jgi:protease-4